MNNAALEQVPLFSNAAPASRNALSKLSKRRFYLKNELILDRSDASQVFLYVLDGWVKLCKESAEGTNIVVDILGNHHYCGEIFIFEPKTEPYRAHAISDVDIILIPTSEIKNVLLSDRTLSLNLLQASLQKQQAMNMEMEHLSIQNAAQRIGCFILRLCDPNITENIFINLPYDKTLLASRLGMRAETFSRALNKLMQECNVKIEGDNVHIPNLQQVTTYVCSHCSTTYPCQDKKDT